MLQAIISNFRLAYKVESRRPRTPKRRVSGRFRSDLPRFVLRINHAQAGNWEISLIWG
jgi:hypothetical protein